jgi:aerobic-type carbon monoxide dehydrogenase small subunit (CoxS/CutS family)
MKPKDVANKEVTTLEGLPEETRKQIADSFVQCGGVQCGFCIPGMAMRGHSIVETNPNPVAGSIAYELRAHPVPVHGYVKIVDAIQQYAALRAGESAACAGQFRTCGQRRCSATTATSWCSGFQVHR